MAQILITGGGGVAGTALTEYLRELGQDVFTLTSRRDCNLEDYKDTSALFASVRPTHVYHLAGAVYGIGGNTAFPGDVFRRNTLMNVNVVEACREFAVEKIVAMGSAAIYADGLSQPMQEEDCLKGEPHNSEYAYAFAKRGLLVQLKSYAKQFGLRYAFAISTNLYGPHDRFDPQYGHVIPSLLKKFEDASRNGDTVQIWGDGTPTRDFLYSRDAAAGLQLMMKAGNGVYNLATGTSCSIGALVAEIALRYPTVRYEWDVSKPLGQLSRAYSVARLVDLGFGPSFDLRKGIAATSEWLKQNVGIARI